MIYFTKFMRPAGATCTEIAPKRIFRLRLLTSALMTHRFTDRPHIPDKFFTFLKGLFDAAEIILCVRHKKTPAGSSGWRFGHI